MAARARERERRDGGRGGSPAWHLGDPIRVAIVGATGYVGSRAGAAARPPSGGHDRRAGRSRSRRRAGRRDPPPPRLDATSRRRRSADRRRRLPRPAPRHGRRARPGDRRRRRHGDRPRARLPATRPGRLSALVRLQPSPSGAPRDRRVRAARAPSAGARRTPRRFGADRRGARLLSRPRRSSRSRRSPGPG